MSMVNTPSLPCNQEPTCREPTVQVVKCGPSQKDQRKYVPMMHLGTEISSRYGETGWLESLSAFQNPAGSISPDCPQPLALKWYMEP